MPNQNRWLLLSLAAPGSDTDGGRVSRRAPLVSAHTVTKALRSSLQHNFGDLASGALGGPLNCKYYSQTTGTGIVRCARQGVRTVWAAATLIRDIDGTRVRISICHCGGAQNTDRHNTKGTTESDRARQADNSST